MMHQRAFLWALSTLLLLPLANTAVARAQGLNAERLRCDYAENPIGIDAARPRLSWIVTSRGRAQRQTAYQIAVSSTPNGSGDLWDTGKVTSTLGGETAVVYAGAPLRAGQQAWWRVRVWDKDGGESAWSRPARWEMGLLQPSDFAAKWITVDAKDDTNGDAFAGAKWIWQGDAGAGERVFRRRFDLAMLPETARLSISADDQFSLTLNGRAVGRSSGRTDAWRKPGVFDVRPFLKTGENVLVVTARNTGDAAGLIVGLLAGSTTIATGGDWEAATGENGPWQPVRVVADYGGAPWGRFGGGGAVGPGRYLRRSFATASGKTVRGARLYASALGVYEAYLNGKRVGNDVFAPGWTDYKKRIPYQTYDVSRLVRGGKNGIGLMLSDGWYAGHVGLAGRGVYGTTPMAWAQLRIDYADGTSETIGTDTSWRGSTDGPVVASDMLMGENYDARREDAFRRWADADFVDTSWPAARIGEPGTGRMEAQVGPPVRAFESLSPKKITQPKPGSFVFDLGQNMVGWARLKARGPAGRQITLRFAEMLNPDGTIYTTNYRGARCTDTYTLKGDDRTETYEPHFTFRGFRYVEVTGWPENSAPPTRDAIAGVVVHSDTPRVGTMATSLPMVNQLLKNIDWGQRGNFLAVPTDCPQRDERLGWMGDAQIFIRTAAYNRDVAGFFAKWLVDVDDAQSAAGAFSDVSPRVAAGEGVAAWGDAGVICPWASYLVYGDKRFLADHYDAMTKWVEYCRRNSNGLLRPASGYGDWLSIRADTPKDVLATAYFAYSTSIVAQAAKELGKTEDAARYDELFQQIKAAFNRAYVAPDGTIKGDTQTVYVVALRFGLLSDALRPVAAKRLAENIGAREGHLSTGFVGVGYLCPVLSDMGYRDVAYRLLNNDTFPSWGYSIKQGATTIWERWDGWTTDKGFQDAGMNSFNHYSLGSVGEWLYGYVGGIQPDPASPGYAHIRIRPEPGGGMTHAKTTYDSVRGPIATDWKIDAKQYALNVSIPANTTATVWVATSDPTRVAAPAGATFVRAEPGFAVYEIGSGAYRFTAAPMK